MSALAVVAGLAARLIFQLLMGFITFGSVAALFASMVALAIWIVGRLIR